MEQNKTLCRELFNIYDIVVFEDENGITQDCVCNMLKNKDEGAEVVSVVGCNNHDISIYEDGSYKVWEKDGKDLPYYATDKKIIHLYTLKNDNRFYEIYPTDDYKITENANPSQALKTLGILDQTISPLLEPILSKYEDDLSDKINANYFALKKALIKAKEQDKEVKAFDILKEYFDIQIIETDSKEMATITISRKDSTDALHFAQKLIKDKEKINLLKEVLK